MDKYEFNKEENERLTEVRVYKVWLKEDLLSNKSEFKSIYPTAWKLINEGAVTEDFPLSDMKQMIVTNEDLFIIIITTEGKGKKEVDGRILPSKHISQKAFLTDKRSFIDITMLLGITNLAGCRFQHINPPFENFVSECIGEKYF
jgi:hypothetical protein